MEQVTWHEAKAYCEKTGKRLPTEWEWEKAERAGTKTKYYWGDETNSTHAWYLEDWKSGHHPVGQKEPNSYGLYYMSGNVWEWTSNWYDDNKRKSKVLRGGSWLNDLYILRLGYRFGDDPTYRSYVLGFRCVVVSSRQ